MGYGNNDISSKVGKQLTFFQVILEGCTGENDPPVCLDFIDGYGQSCLFILQNMSFITHHQVWTWSR